MTASHCIICKFTTFERCEGVHVFMHEKSVAYAFSLNNIHTPLCNLMTFILLHVSSLLLHAGHALDSQ